MAQEGVIKSSNEIGGDNEKTARAFPKHGDELE
jgi:hypothetical protein